MIIAEAMAAELRTNSRLEQLPGFPAWDESISVFIAGVSLVVGFDDVIFRADTALKIAYQAA